LSCETLLVLVAAVWQCAKALSCLTEALNLVREALVQTLSCSNVQWVTCERLAFWLGTALEQGRLVDTSDLWAIQLGTTLEQGVLVDAIDHLGVYRCLTAEALTKTLCLVREALVESLSCETLLVLVAAVWQCAKALSCLTEALSCLTEALSLVREALVEALCRSNIQWVTERSLTFWLGQTTEQGCLLDASDLWAIELGSTLEQRVLVDTVDHLGVHLCLTTKVLCLVCEALVESLSRETLLVLVAAVWQCAETLCLVGKALLVKRCAKTSTQWVRSVAGDCVLLDASYLIVETLTSKTLVVKVAHHF